MSRLHVGTFPDGSQLLIAEWFDASDMRVKITAAVRPSTDTRVVWGAPIELDEVDG